MTSPTTLDYQSAPPSSAAAFAARAKVAVKGVLLVFVLVSVGFALGKEFTLRSVRSAQAGGNAPAIAGDKVLVYYVHGTIRCITCNNIEKLAHEIVQKDFASDLQAGRIEWRMANFQTDEDLARRYDIVSSTVVLVKVSQGREVQSRKLNDVWILVDDPPAFNAYVTSEIKKLLDGGRS